MIFFYIPVDRLKILNYCLNLFTICNFFVYKVKSTMISFASCIYHLIVIYSIIWLHSLFLVSLVMSQIKYYHGVFFFRMGKLTQGPTPEQQGRFQLTVRGCLFDLFAADPEKVKRSFLCPQLEDTPCHGDWGHTHSLSLSPSLPVTLVVPSRGWRTWLICQNRLRIVLQFIMLRLQTVCEIETS